ncbi:hypothetical protein QFC20_001453 [Naganishia adeliensis]|uniref:Uncharacterized protein n=1 Tax=Naganishia adeliensis TaxID=92952 RepID=A0ACC2WS20_9TREE|nr:hypothetical protein QFC20_001453 [Naganishia adeliensis]
MPSLDTPRSQKRFLKVCSLHHLSTHTRFQLSLRTISSPKRYHKLLLFRLSPVTRKESSDVAEDPSSSIQQTDDGDRILKDVELYCMEATCPHLSAPLSHAEFAEPEVDEDHREGSHPCEGTTNGQSQEDQEWDLEPEMRDMEDVVGQPGRTIVCPWHLYDFDLRDGSSSTGMSVCVYSVEVRQELKHGRDESEWDVYVEEPEVEGYVEEDERSPNENRWEIVEIRGVSEDFADPPPPRKQATVAKAEGSEARDGNPNPGIMSSITSALGRTLNIGGESPTSVLEQDSELPTKTLLSSALLILQTSSAAEKIRRTRQTLNALRTGKFKSLKPIQKDVNAAKELFEPLEPAEEEERISRGEDVKQGKTVEGFVPPRDDNIKTVDVWNVKSRGKGGNEKSRILMLHALANIEQWAIDLSLSLSWDIMARFADFEINGERLPAEFFLDWAKVAEDEAKHFSLLSKRLEELGSYFGAHSVHAGLWDSALETSHSLLSRLAIIHLVAEARGLDVNPMTIEKFRKNKDFESVKVLETIHNDEITRLYHRSGGRCDSLSDYFVNRRDDRAQMVLLDRMNLDPVEQFRKEVRENFRGKIKGPFNTDDRLTAGMTADYYTDLEGFAVSRRQASQDKPTQTSGEKTVPAVNRQHEEGDLRIQTARGRRSPYSPTIDMML